MKTRIVGLWSGHDCSYCVLDEGYPNIHYEYERHLREKEPPGDSVQLYFDTFGHNPDLVKYFATCHPIDKLGKYVASAQKLRDLKVPLITVGHHCAHAANAFFSSNVDEALVVTIDGGGVETSGQGYSTVNRSDQPVPDLWSMAHDTGPWRDGGGGGAQETAHTVWVGNGSKIEHRKTFSAAQVNIGGLWTRVTRYVFKLQNGWPYGHQAGTIMSMAAFGDPGKYKKDFARMLSDDLLRASMKPAGQPVGAYVPGKDPVHPYLSRWVKLAEQNEQEQFDLAAGLQAATEDQVRTLLDQHVRTYAPNCRHLCLAGGVSLNSVITGKLQTWFPQLESVFVTPVPYDGGLSIGAAQFVWHHMLGNSRHPWTDCFPTYLGAYYTEADVVSAIAEFGDRITQKISSDEEVVTLLNEGKIISVFNERAESGRRALGNRSILADPRSTSMKDKINQRVKHRASHRPFAPSIMAEHVKDWFERDVSSPYMEFVLKFKPEMGAKVPAVVHVDGTARLQTVTEAANPWYYNLLKLWNEKTGVPILLNTSFNDKTPICDSPTHAIECFLGTEIDHIYFPEYKLLVRKR